MRDTATCHVTNTHHCMCHTWGCADRYSHLDRISRHTLLPTAIFIGMHGAVHGATMVGFNVVPMVLDTPLFDYLVSSLLAYQLMGKPEETSIAVVYHSLWILDKIGSTNAKPILTK